MQKTDYRNRGIGSFASIALYQDRTGQDRTGQDRTEQDKTSTSTGTDTGTSTDTGTGFSSSGFLSGTGFSSTGLSSSGFLSGTVFSFFLNMTTTQREISITLTGQADWDEWIEVIRTTATGYGIWDYVDPSKPDLIALTEPVRPTPNDVRPS